MATPAVAGGDARRRARIAVIDDDASLNRSLVLHLEETGYRVASFTSGRAAVEALTVDPPDLALLDVQLRDADGIAVLRELRRARPAPAVVMITAFHETRLTVEAVKAGAFDYMPKPFSLDALDRVIERALARQAAEAALHPAEAQQRLEDADARHRLIGASAPMLELLKTIGAVSNSDATVLIEGESGTGKELVARKIHAHSQRTGPLLCVNCATLSSELLASELFGHEKGAFTGASARRKGTFELADGGTVFLDEVSEMDMPVQAMFLRVLQEREFQRLGGSDTLRTDVRVIAATNRVLDARVSQGLFRRDLYFRLAVVPIRVPPLRERREDVPLLADHVLHTRTRTLDGRPFEISAEALRRLVEHDWPGNVRELENVIVRASLRARGTVILDGDLELPCPEAGGLEAWRPRSLDDVERDHIARVLSHTAGHKAEAARILGISRPTLDSKIKRYGLDGKRPG